MALTVPDGSLALINCLSDLEFFVGTLTLNGSGNGSIAHGLTQPTRPPSGYSTAKPTVAFIIPQDGEDHSSAAITVTATNVVVAGGAANGVVVVVAIGASYSA